MGTASSASERHDAAVAALAGYDRVAASGLGTGYPSDDLASALRAMISPASVEEGPREYALAQVREYVAAQRRGASPDLMDVIERAYRSGIQVAWESWEPETAPGLPSGTVEQLRLELIDSLSYVESQTDPRLLAARVSAALKGDPNWESIELPKEECSSCHRTESAEVELGHGPNEDLCYECAMIAEGYVLCPNCDQWKREDLGVWDLAEGKVIMCSSCEHNARRSGWEPGQ